MTHGSDDEVPEAVDRASAPSDEAAAALDEAVAKVSEERTETEERYSRPGADRLSEEMLAEIRTRTTGATEAAFFDLDKTIIARSSTLVLGRSFMRDGLLGAGTVLKGLYAQIVYHLVGADHEKMEQMRHAVLELSKGWEADRVRRIVRETMEDVIVPLVYQEALDLIEQHRRAGRDVWIVSSAGEEIVLPFASHLGIDDVIATRSGIDEDGRYDGTLEFYAYAANKATAIRQVAEVRGYDLSGCYCYSDSITDLPMLAAVGHPVAVNPDRELRAAATAMEWEIRDVHSPVSLRDRLPDLRRPHTNEVLWAGLGVLVAGLLVWRYVLEGEE